MKKSMVSIFVFGLLISCYTNATHNFYFKNSSATHNFQIDQMIHWYGGNQPWRGIVRANDTLVSPGWNPGSWGGAPAATLLDENREPIRTSGGSTIRCQVDQGAINNLQMGETQYFTVGDDGQGGCVFTVDN